MMKFGQIFYPSSMVQKLMPKYPRKDKVPKILPNDFNPKHSVIFNEIKAPNPPNPIPKIIIPIHIPKIFPNDKRITDNPID